MIDAQAEMALSSEGFTEIDVQTMKTILERETLNCRETVVFKAALAWAQAECQRKGIELSGEECEKGIFTSHQLTTRRGYKILLTVYYISMQQQLLCMPPKVDI